MAAFYADGRQDCGDKWGRRKAFVIGSVVYGIGSFITALSPNLSVLLSVGRYWRPWSNIGYSGYCCFSGY